MEIDIIIVRTDIKPDHAFIGLDLRSLHRCQYFRLFLWWAPGKFILQGSAPWWDFGWIKTSELFLFKVVKEWLSKGKWERRICLIPGLIFLKVDYGVSYLKIVYVYAQIYICVVCMKTNWNDFVHLLFLAFKFVRWKTKLYYYF